MLKHDKSVHKVEVLDIFNLAILMLEQTPLTIRAVELLIEGCASFGLVLLVVDWRCFPHQLILTMSKLAFVPVSA